MAAASWPTWWSGSPAGPAASLGRGELELLDRHQRGIDDLLVLHHNVERAAQKLADHVARFYVVLGERNRERLERPEHDRLRPLGRTGERRCKLDRFRRMYAVQEKIAFGRERHHTRTVLLGNIGEPLRRGAL